MRCELIKRFELRAVRGERWMAVAGGEEVLGSGEALGGVDAAYGDVLGGFRFGGLLRGTSDGLLWGWWGLR